MTTNKAMEKLALREFGSTDAIVVDVRKKAMAGTFKAKDCKEHFDKLR